MLPLSHDEVTHGKGSLLSKMSGDDWQMFANLRAYYGFMWAHPGKKLLFMGQEFAQRREWRENVSLDWHLLDAPAHKGVQTLSAISTGCIRNCGALHARDSDPGGFAWIIGDDHDQSVFAFARFGDAGDPPVVVISNFTPEPRHGYRVGLPQAGAGARSSTRTRQSMAAPASAISDAVTANGYALARAAGLRRNHPAAAGDASI